MKVVSLPPTQDDGLLESFVEVILDPCVVLSGSGKVLAANHAWRDLPRRHNTANNLAGDDYCALYETSTADETSERAIKGIKDVLSGQRKFFEHIYLQTGPHALRCFRMTVHAWRRLGAGAIVFHRDITGEKLGRAHSQAVEHKFRLLADSQEEERRRIAREIHDDFTQRLALVSMKIGNLAGRDRSSTPAEFSADLEDIREMTAAVTNDLRDLSRQLHPAMLELVGLTRALQAQCEEFERVRRIKTIFDSSLTDEDVSPQIATCLYRVLQESLMNIARHSGSISAHVTLNRRINQIEMKIRDEGLGFNPNAKRRNGIGLLNMEERVRFLHGEFVINSKPGSPTEIAVRIPIISKQ